jgi:large subunit ribosomal protein L23
MAFNLFGKKNQKKTTKPAKAEKVVAVSETKEAGAMPMIAGGTVLKHFYVSEKAARLMEMNQYIFKVTDDASKGEIAKQVAALYKVVVKDVKVLNMPTKRRDTGRRPGVRSGFRKAIVVLAEGNTIEQAKP